MRTAHFRLAAVVLSGLLLGACAACGGSSPSGAPSPHAPLATSAAPAPSTPLAPSASSAPTASAASALRGLTGIVTSVAGNGRDDGSGVPGAASTASLGSATQFAVASDGDIFCSNGGLEVLRISQGRISVYGHLDPHDGPGSRGIAVAPDGSVYVATANVVYRFAPGGKRTVVLAARTAGLPTSLGPIVIDPAGVVYVGDGSPRLRRLASHGKTTVIAGTKTQAPADSAPGDNGPAAKAALGTISQVAIDANGNLLVADVKSHRIRQVATDGTITTIAGGGGTPLLSNAQQYAPDGVMPTDLQLAQVTGVAVDATGRIYVADAGSQAIFRFVPGGGIELVAADQHGSSDTPGLPANQTRVTNVGALAFDQQGDLLFFQSGVIHQLAGAGV